MVLNRVEEVVKLTDINEVNEYLQEQEEFHFKLQVWELIACVPETTESGKLQTVYILGRKWIPAE